MTEEGPLRFAYEHLQAGWTVLSFALGLYLGNRFALFRDKRKEWNDRTEDAYRALKKGQLIGSIDAVLIESYLPRWKRKGFAMSLERYYQTWREAQSSYDPAKGMCSVDPAMNERLDQCTAHLLSFLGRR